MSGSSDALPPVTGYVIGLSSRQVKILELMGTELGRSRWWSAMDVVGALGEGSGPGIGGALKGLYKRGLLRRRAPSRQEGRLQPLYQIREGSCGTE